MARALAVAALAALAALLLGAGAAAGPCETATNCTACVPGALRFDGNATSVVLEVNTIGVAPTLRAAAPLRPADAVVFIAAQRFASDRSYLLGAAAVGSGGALLVEYAVIGSAGVVVLGFADRASCASANLSVTLVEGQSPLLITFLVSLGVFSGGVLLHVAVPRLLRRLGAMGVRVPARPTLRDVATLLAVHRIPPGVSPGVRWHLQLEQRLLLLALGPSLLYVVVTVLNAALGTVDNVYSYASLTNVHVGAEQVSLQALVFAALSIYVLPIGAAASLLLYTQRSARWQQQQQPSAALSRGALVLTKLPIHASEADVARVVDGLLLRSSASAKLGPVRCERVLFLATYSQGSGAQVPLRNAIVVFSQCVSVRHLRRLARGASRGAAGAAGAARHDGAASTRRADLTRSLALPSDAQQPALLLLASGQWKRLPPLDDLSWPALCEARPRRCARVSMRLLFLGFVLVVGTGIVAGGLLLDQLLRTAVFLRQVRQLPNSDTLLAFIGVAAPLVLTLISQFARFLRDRVLHFERWFDLGKKAASTFGFSLALDFAFRVFGPFLWFVVGQIVLDASFVGLSADVAQRSGDLALYVMSFALQEALLVPGITLMNLPSTLSFVLCWLRYRKHPDFAVRLTNLRVSASHERAFGIAPSLVVFLNTWIVLIMGDAPAMAAAPLILLCMHLLERYYAIFVATSVTSLGAPQRIYRSAAAYVLVFALLVLVAQVALAFALRASEPAALVAQSTAACVVAALVVALFVATLLCTRRRFPALGAVVRGRAVDVDAVVRAYDPHRAGVPLASATDTPPRISRELGELDKHGTALSAPPPHSSSSAGAGSSTRV